MSYAWYPRSQYRSILGARDGAASIEFALCATGFLALLIGTLQVALVFFVQNSVQTVAETVARQVLTGQIPSGMTHEQFRTRACATLPAFLKCSNLYVDVRKLDSFGEIAPFNAGLSFDASGRVRDSTQFELGGAGDIVILRLLYDWPIGTAPLGLRLGDQNSASRIIVGTMAFKAEPYA